MIVAVSRLLRNKSMNNIEPTIGINNNQFVNIQANGCNANLFIYRIEGMLNDKYHTTLGLLCSYKKNKFEKKSIIYPHEAVDELRLKGIQQSMIDDNGVNTPSFLVTKSTIFPQYQLIELFDSEIPVATFENNGLTHSVVMISDTYSVRDVMSSINCIDNFLIADGHHRFMAYEQQTNVGLDKLTLPVFITNTTQARVKSFGLICHVNNIFDWQQFPKYLEWLGLITCDKTKADYLINYQGQSLALKYNPLVHHVDSHQVGYDHSFMLSQLGHFSGIDTISSEALVSQTENHYFTHAGHSSYLSIEIKSPQINTIYNAALKGVLCPKKSTCFLFKPFEGILNTLQQDLQIAS